MNTLTAPSVRLAVLPSTDLSGDPEHAYFGRGITEDLITDLSRFPNLGIISSHTSFAEKLQELDDRAVAQELGLDYLLKISTRRRGEQLRLNAQLIQSATGNVLWAERIDTKAEQVLAIQDSMVEKVTSSLSKHIDSATLQEARKKPITELAAYDCWLRGLEKLHDGTIKADEEARSYFKRALEVDPHYARAYTGLSLSYFNEWSCQLWERSEISECLAYENASKAIKLDENDHVSHLVLGRVYLYRRHFDRAEWHLDRSLTLNANDSDSLVQIGSCKSFLGKPDEGAMLFERATNLNPFCDTWYYAYGAFNYFMLRQYDQCIAYAMRASVTAVWVDLSAYIAMAYAYSGDEPSAKKYLSMFLETFRKKITRGRFPENGEVVRWLKLVNPFKKPSDIHFLVEGIQLAGLKEEMFLPNGMDTVHALEHSPDHSVNVFRAENGMRRVTFHGKETMLPELKGYKDLEILLSKPGML